MLQIFTRTQSSKQDEIVIGIYLPLLHIPSPPSQEPRVIKEGEQPVKKKKPYYRKKYNKPKPVEDVAPKKYKNADVEPINLIAPVKQYLFVKGLLVGSVLTAIICHIIYSI